MRKSKKLGIIAYRIAIIKRIENQVCFQIQIQRINRAVRILSSWIVTIARIPNPMAPAAAPDSNQESVYSSRPSETQSLNRSHAIIKA